MRNWHVATLSCAMLLGVHSPVGAAAGAPAPERVLRARVALRFDPATRCPEVRPAGEDDEVVAVVLFQVGSTGVPSQASIQSSSRSEALDAAAVNCVLKLRFQPATRAGDGVAIDSWQQMAWKWPRTTVHHEEPAAVTPALPPAPASQRSQSGAAVGSVEVHACVDETGKLLQDPSVTRSSGDAGLDAAAVAIARSGAGHYRPAPGQSASGCVQLTIRFQDH